MPHLSRLIVVVCLTALVATAPLFAQEREESTAGIEIGTLFGLSHAPDESDALTVIGAPGSPVSYWGNPALYVFWFPSEALSIGPEFSLSRTSSKNGFAFNTLYLGGRGALSLRVNTMSGAYVLVQGALSVVNNGASTAI